MKAVIKLAESRAVDVVHVFEVHHKLTVASIQQFLQYVAESHGSFAQSDAAADVEDHDVVQTS